MQLTMDSVTTWRHLITDGRTTMVAYDVDIGVNAWSCIITRIIGKRILGCSATHTSRQGLPCAVALIDMDIHAASTLQICSPCLGEHTAARNKCPSSPFSTYDIAVQLHDNSASIVKHTVQRNQKILITNGRSCPPAVTSCQSSGLLDCTNRHSTTQCSPAGLE